MVIDLDKLRKAADLVRTRVPNTVRPDLQSLVRDLCDAVIALTDPAEVNELKLSKLGWSEPLVPQEAWRPQPASPVAFRRYAASLPGDLEVANPTLGLLCHALSLRTRANR